MYLQFFVCGRLPVQCKVTRWRLGKRSLDESRCAYMGVERASAVMREACALHRVSSMSQGIR